MKLEKNVKNGERKIKGREEGREEGKDGQMDGWIVQDTLFIFPNNQQTDFLSKQE